MNSLLLFAALLAVTLLSFAFGIFTWFVVYRSFSVGRLPHSRGVMLGFSVVAIIFVGFVDVIRYMFSETVRSDPEQRIWLFLSPCFVAATAFAHVLALHLKIRRLAMPHDQ